METVVLNLAIQMKLPNKWLVYSACSPGLGNGPRNQEGPPVRSPLSEVHTHAYMLMFGVC